MSRIFSVRSARVTERLLVLTLADFARHMRQFRCRPEYRP
jgi:hypothetical protein